MLQLHGDEPQPVMQEPVRMQHCQCEALASARAGFRTTSARHLQVFSAGRMGCLQALAAVRLATVC
eukprot:365396-Chlamydomonas_euryale.AAC.18